MLLPSQVLWAKGGDIHHQGKTTEDVVFILWHSFSDWTMSIGGHSNNLGDKTQIVPSISVGNCNSVCVSELRPHNRFVSYILPPVGTVQCGHHLAEGEGQADPFSYL